MRIEIILTAAALAETTAALRDKAAAVEATDPDHATELRDAADQHEADGGPVFDSVTATLTQGPGAFIVQAEPGIQRIYPYATIRRIKTNTN